MFPTMYSEHMIQALLASIPAEVVVNMTNEQRDWMTILATILSIVAVIAFIGLIVERKKVDARLDRLEHKVGIPPVPPAA